MLSSVGERLISFPALDAFAGIRHAEIQRHDHQGDRRPDIDPRWAVRPLAIGQDRDRTVLLLEDL